MPRVELPGDAQIGALVRLHDGTLVRLDAFPNAASALVALPDGSQRIVPRADCDLEPIRPRDQARRDALDAISPGYRRFCVQHYDGAGLVTRVFAGTGARARAQAFAGGKVLFGEQAAPREIEP